MGYKLYNPITKKIFNSRDVIFEEEAMWDWKQNENTKGAEFILAEEELAEPS